MYPCLTWLALVAVGPLVSPPVEPAGSRQAAPRAAAAQPEPDEPYRGFFPFLGGIVSASGLSAGGGYRYEAIEDTPVGVEAAAMWSVRGYQLYRVRAGLNGASRRALELRQADSGVASMFNDAAVKRPGAALFVEARYRSYPRHPYYGIGGDSRGDDVSAFRLTGPAYDLVGQWQITRSFGLSARGGVLETAVDSRRGDRERPSVDERFEAASVPGFLDPPRYVVFGAGAVLDRRDSPRDPTRGFLIGGTAWRFQARGRRFDFARTTLDARAFVPVAGPTGVVALRLLVAADWTDPGSRVPFFLLQTVGGGETLRSYPNLRWRERALAHLTAEYRWHPHRLVEVAPFVDLASLGRTLGRLSADGRLYSVGVAVRGHWKGRALGRLEWAVGPEGQRVVFSTGPIF
jgi:hypothetical protein